ncbi:unnamed protein product [Clonostachys byssicola]|uniref:Zn(2)-C6 fungal-type domain-containing protein n=1 Tax=Clonostachys byssicola TaxID=160290 RepID=A0A9N9UU24_9HYPO|nr:unnamed protein product [Clonostachys byssicola]
MALGPQKFPLRITNIHHHVHLRFHLPQISMQPALVAMHKPHTKHTRTRTGCLNCRRKKRKCDERRPVCGTCRRREESCVWGVQLKFLTENAKGISDEHPSMRKLRAKRQNSCFEILDVTEDVIRDYDSASPPLMDDDFNYGGDDDGVVGVSCHGDRGSTGYTHTRKADGTSLMDEDAIISPSSVEHTLLGGYSEWVDTSSPSSLRQTESAVANLIYLSQGGSRTDPRCDEQSNIASSSFGLWPLDISEYSDLQLDDDGIFLPGTAYHELHSTLRSHLIQEVRSNDPTRPPSPLPTLEELDVISEEVDDIVDDLSTAEQTVISRDQILSREEEVLLWRNWFDEIAPWLDKFDNDQHFKHVIPTMAPSNSFLQYSVLALSARQIELKETTLPHDRSLLLYQQAIHLLLPHLPSRTTAVIASCVILCVLEMVSCSPKAWRRHLDGCACLLSAVGISGFSSGVEGALFWCFARMDVCGGLISSVKTLIPISQWAPGSGVDADVELFKTKMTDFHNWANFAVYLVALVLDFLETTALDAGGRLELWMKLWGYIAEWHDLRPAALHSIVTLPSSEKSPFPTVLFSNPAAISGNQLYHTASLLMLQNRPAGLRLSSLGTSSSSVAIGAAARCSTKARSILWHARQVCGISISNDHHGAWTNALQPIWIAGRCMSHPAEHKAILELLDKIERESGWSTRWRADDLREFWGDLGE